MSKLSTLKQEAYQAGKKRNWAQAIMLYEQILERDKNNPTVINELGDLCLKGGETSRAVRHFLTAAAKYRTTGLLNNSVAIYKKILRHDAENLNAHWYLGETRANQGFTVEAENHAIHFLDNSGNVAGDIKEIFLKRCQSLFELFPHSRVVLSRLTQIFNMWTMHLEAARAECLLACMDFSADKKDEARATIDGLTAKVPELLNYPEFVQWKALVDPNGAASAPYSTFGEVAFDTAGESGESDIPEASATAPANEFDELDTATVADQGAVESEPAAAAEVPMISIPVAADPVPEAPDSPEPEANPAARELDGDGCFDIGAGGGGTDIDDLIAQASDSLHHESSDSEAPDEPVVPGPDMSGDEGPADAMGNAPETSDGAGLVEPAVDLLAEMLGKDGPGRGAESSDELATITSEIGSAIGGDDEDDAERLYDMGMVYLEMGLFDQACDSFETAAADEEFSARAYEMWGITLQRDNRYDEAISVLTEGLDFTTDGTRERHGLMYHLGLAKENNGQADEAIECFRAINEVDPAFADVGRRLARLTTV